MSVAPDTAVHRIGGCGLANLRLSALDRAQTPPGLSVLLGGTPHEAAGQMRRAYPRSRKWSGPQMVATATAEAIRRAGFEVIPDPTRHFPNHACIIHVDGESGFTGANLAVLSAAFTETAGC
jgi:hypothetical protein